MFFFSLPPSFRLLLLSLRPSLPPSGPSTSVSPVLTSPPLPASFILFHHSFYLLSVLLLSVLFLPLYSLFHLLFYPFFSLLCCPLSRHLLVQAYPPPPLLSTSTSAFVPYLYLSTSPSCHSTLISTLISSLGTLPSLSHSFLHLLPHTPPLCSPLRWTVARSTGGLVVTLFYTKAEMPEEEQRRERSGE